MTRAWSAWFHGISPDAGREALGCWLTLCLSPRQAGSSEEAPGRHVGLLCQQPGVQKAGGSEALGREESLCSISGEEQEPLRLRR